MDTAWIQVFVLSLSECVAPAGKTVCQEQVLQYQFYDQAECEAVLEQLIEYKSNADNIIVNAEKSQCLPTLRQSRTFDSLRQANRELGDVENWEAPPDEQTEPPETAAEHAARLDKLPDCDNDYNVTPCKVGQIIVESDASKEVPVWRRNTN